MGTNKLLLKVEDKTIIERILETVTEVTEQTVVVLGHKPEELKPLTNSFNVQRVMNENYTRGMTSSFKKGLTMVKTEAAFLVLGDQLGIEPSIMNTMADKMEKDDRVLVVSPVYQGKRGHPVLLRDELFPKILALDKRKTIKDLVNRFEEFHHTVKGNQFSVMDFDTPEEFSNIVKLWKSTRF
jgi:molybdenum cofactor cytidylyltransferase